MSCSHFIIWINHICKEPSGCIGAGASLTHWGRVRHTYVSKLTIIGPNNGLSPGRRQAIIWTNDGIFLIGTLETNFSEITIKIYTFSFKKIRLKMSSGKWWPSCLGLNVLILSLESLQLWRVMGVWIQRRSVPHAQDSHGMVPCVQVNLTHWSLGSLLPKSWT